MFLRPIIPLLAVLCATSCAPAPQWYPPPIQRAFHPEFEPRMVGAIVSMDSPQVESYIIGGILGGTPGSQWRWANPRAEVRLQLTEAKAHTFYIDFVIADATFKETGPVTFTFSIDGKPFATQRFETPGEKHFETRLDAARLNFSEPMIIAAEVDKYFTSKEDGVKLAFLFQRAGFRE